jgi:hypothetical protein
MDDIVTRAAGVQVQHIAARICSEPAKVLSFLRNSINHHR